MTDRPDPSDSENIDWTVTTWAGNRRLQHEAFRALSFREKVERLEEMEAVAMLFRRARETSADRGLGDSNSAPDT